MSKLSGFTMLPDHTWKCDLCFEVMLSDERMSHICADPKNDHDWQDKGLNSAECSQCKTIVGWDNIDFWEECPPEFNKKEDCI